MSGSSAILDLASPRSGNCRCFRRADGEAPCIASVSFGDARNFVLRRMQGVPYTGEWRPVVPSRMVRYALGDGSLLVMSGTTQRYW